ncbi:MAG TPA: tetratricopeptide repeat protein [Agitococcus sp.]|nr:tetratricopeptide repeat protein [Agitococcus sp.]
MRLLSFAILITSLSIQTTWADTVLTQAETFLNNKQIVQAYDLLAPLEDQRAGEPAYDYLYGMVLLEAGEPSRAAFAFERCLGAEPNNGPCRVQMARTHIALGETTSSRKELETVKEYNPPPQVQNLVDQYLGITKQVEDNKKRQINHFVEIGAAYDSNINSATENSKIAIPSFNNFTIFLTVPHRETSSVLKTQMGSSLQYQFNPDLVGLLDGALSYYTLFDNNNFDYYTLDANAGLLKNIGNYSVQGKLQLQKMGLDGQAYRDVIGLLTQIQKPIGETSQVAAFGQYNQLRYDTQSARDANRFTLGLAYSQQLEMRFSPTFYTSVYTGQENTTDSQFDYFSHSLNGLRLGGSINYLDNLRFNSHISVEKRDYAQSNQFFFPFNHIKRQDKETSVELSATWSITTKYRLQPRYNYTQNNANIPVNDYKRHVVGVDLHLDF